MDINDSRDLALLLIENKMISKDDLIMSLLKYMSCDDVFDCLKVNEHLPLGDMRNYWTYTHLSPALNNPT